jgi:polar amino acid transport system substrate-binding protein
MMARPMVFFLAAAFGVAACSDRQDDALVVGMEMAYPPFEMRNERNEPDGISVRMAEDLAGYLGRPLKIVDIAWDGIIPALQAGKIDLILSSLTRTEEREKSIDFSDGYVTNGLCMLVARDSEIHRVEDLAGSGRKVAVKLGTTGHTWARANLDGVELIVLEEPAACVMEVAQKKAAAFIYDQISIYRHWQRHRDTTRAILNPIREETWGIGLRKNEPELLGQVNAWLKQYREAGRFDELAERYMGQERRDFESMGVPFIFH